MVAGSNERLRLIAAAISKARLSSFATLTALTTACGGSPTAIQNAPPAVNVAFEAASSCTPRPGAPCSLTVVATATDPDGDALRYRWSGCASGAAARATCMVLEAGPAVASVEVRDDHDHIVNASITAHGVAPNGPPTVTAAFDGPSTCVQEGSRPCSLTVVAQATDPDGDPLQYSWSGCASGTSARATCTVERIGAAVARVEVSDDHGHTVSATLSGEGVPAPNGGPTVSAGFRGASDCTPLPGKPCSLEVAAQATDPEGDSLRYQWSGCASGTSPVATCIVDRPGSFTALIDVTDSHGNARRAAATGFGINRPPGVQIGYATLRPSGAIELLGNVADPDEGFLCGREYCVSASTSGACTSASLDCTCMGGLSLEVVRTAPTGICTVTFSLKDSWGQIGTPSVSFDVSNPKPPKTP